MYQGMSMQPHHVENVRRGPDKYVVHVQMLMGHLYWNIVVQFVENQIQEGMRRG